MDTLSREEKSALILIGFQKGLDEIEYWGPQRNNTNAERNASQLLDIWRSMGFPVIHVRLVSSDFDSPFCEDDPGSQFKDELKPDNREYVILNKDGVCTGEGVRRILSSEGVKKVMFAGIPTDRCVSSAIHMVSTYGYEAFVVYDATATFGRPHARIPEQMYSAELIHDTALASINNEFASVIMMSEVIEAMSNYDVEVRHKKR